MSWSANELNVFGALSISNGLQPLGSWWSLGGNPKRERQLAELALVNKTAERGRAPRAASRDRIWFASGEAVLGCASKTFDGHRLPQLTRRMTLPSRRPQAGKLRTGSGICSLNCELSWLLGIEVNLKAVGRYLIWQRCPWPRLRPGIPPWQMQRKTKSLPRREHHRNFFFWWFNHNIDNFIKNYKTDIKKISNS